MVSSWTWPALWSLQALMASPSKWRIHRLFLSYCFVHYMHWTTYFTREIVISNSLTWASVGAYHLSVVAWYLDAFQPSRTNALCSRWRRYSVALICLWAVRSCSRKFAMTTSFFTIACRTRASTSASSSTWTTSTEHNVGRVERTDWCFDFNLQGRSTTPYIDGFKPGCTALLAIATIVVTAMTIM